MYASTKNSRKDCDYLPLATSAILIIYLHLALQLRIRRIMLSAILHVYRTVCWSRSLSELRFMYSVRTRIKQIVHTST